MLSKAFVLGLYFLKYDPHRAHRSALTRLGSLFPATLTALTHNNFASEQGKAIRSNLPPLVSTTKTGKRLFFCHALGARIQRAIYGQMPGCHSLSTLSVSQSDVEGPIRAPNTCNIVDAGPNALTQTRQEAGSGHRRFDDLRAVMGRLR